MDGFLFLNAAGHLRRDVFSKIAKKSLSFYFSLDPVFVLFGKLSSKTSLRLVSRYKYKTVKIRDAPIIGRLSVSADYRPQISVSVSADLLPEAADFLKG